MLYKNPEIKSYSAADLLEAMGPCQNQYTTTTIRTSTGTGVDLDGVIVYNSGLGGFLDAVTNDVIAVGDDDAGAGGNGTINRTFVGFAISELQGKTIVSATLRVYQAAIATDPYSNLNGNIIVDHVNFGSNGLGSDDYDGNTISGGSNIGTISTNTTIEWKTLDVKSAVQNDVDSGRTSSQFRLRFSPTETNSNGVTNRSAFESAENSSSTGNRPELVVTYK